MSNEQIVKDLMLESEKLQYDKGDSQRIYDASGHVTQAFIDLLGAAARFRDEIDSEVTEDSASEMKQIRSDLVEQYAAAQFYLLRLGAMFRISEEALKRYAEYYENPEKPLVVSDL